jgi:endonuclease/exonuclease/phosphatase (EEP) superfamily protein YafD
MEVAAIFLPVWVVGAVLVSAAVAALSRRPRSFLVPLAWALFGLTAVVLPWVPHDMGEPAGATAVTVVVANTYYGNEHVEEVVADVLRQKPDVLVVPEARTAIDERLSDVYDYRYGSSGSFESDVAVFSDYPLAPLPIDIAYLDRSRGARLLVRAPTPFVLWAVHLPKPSLATSTFQIRPGSHSRMIDDLVRSVMAEDLPTVLAGDLNLVDRGRAYRHLTSVLDDATRDSWGGPTSTRSLLPLLLARIDHVLIPEDGWCADHARRFDLSGSDHRGVRVRIGPCD